MKLIIFRSLKIVNPFLKEKKEQILPEYKNFYHFDVTPESADADKIFNTDK